MAKIRESSTASPRRTWNMRLHVAAERAALYARENGLNYSGKEFQIVGSSIVLSNPHIKEFKVRISGRRDPAREPRPAAPVRSDAARSSP